MIDLFRITLAVLAFCSFMAVAILFFICGYAKRNRCFPTGIDLGLNDMIREEKWLFWFGLFVGVGMSLGTLFLVDEKELFKMPVYFSFMCLLNVSLSRSSIFIVQGLKHEGKLTPVAALLKEAFHPELKRSEYKKMFFVSDFFLILAILLFLVRLAPFFGFFKPWLTNL